MERGDFLTIFKGYRKHVFIILIIIIIIGILSYFAYFQSMLKHFRVEKSQQRTLNEILEQDLTAIEEPIGIPEEVLIDITSPTKESPEVSDEVIKSLTAPE